jgi:phospholipid/cholesterol/gamma-HCH transport system substrate-binding protein
MNKKGVGPGRIAIAVAFALSCFGLALFLWVAFGGPIPLSAQGYRFQVPFSEASSLAVQSDVRISGVSVGKVSDIQLGDNGLADATIELNDRYAPIPANTQAMLRQKTLLGETYVELTPGNASGRALPEGGSLPAAQVAPSIQLDEIFRTFNAKTRNAFQVWMQQQAAAFHGRGADLSNAIGELPPFESSANQVLRILSTQSAAVRQLVRGGGETFNALSERRGQLRGLIQSSDKVFSTTARRNADLANVFRILPTFLDESKATLTRLQTFSNFTDPLIRQLRPAAQQLSPTLISAQKLAPDLENLFRGLLRAVPASKRGLPALRSVLRDSLPPLLTRYASFGAQLDPILQVLRNYKHEITGFLGNGAAVLNGANIPAEGGGSKQFKYIRSIPPLAPGALAAYPHRLTTDRTNPYLLPQEYLKLANLGSLDSFETRQCSSGASATLDPNTPNDPSFQARAEGGVPEAQDLFQRVQKYAFGNGLSTSGIPAPSCHVQPNQRSIGVSPEMSRYLHVRREP